MVTIGITTYNRINTLKRMAKSLYSSKLSYAYNICVYDDASTDYDEHFLKGLFPNAKKIYVQAHNLGSDENIRYMYEDFLNTEDEFFFNADSDLIFHREWLNVLLHVIPNTDGIVSAFNTEHHNEYGAKKINGFDLVKKRTLGSAGCMFSRGIVELIAKQLTNETSSAFDWKWCLLLQENGKELYALKNSMVQHIGLTGYNSSANKFDYGEGFAVDSCENGQFINDSLHEMTVIPDRNNKGVMKYSVFPFGSVEKGSNVVIYGSGNYGKEYVKQIQATGFCQITGLVDQNPNKNTFVYAPDSLKDMTYDYVIIAIHNPIEVRDIKVKLVNMGIDGNKIISGACDRIVR